MIFQFAISLIGSGVAGILVGLIFEKRSGKALDSLKESITEDLAEVIDSRIAELSEQNQRTAAEIEKLDKTVNRLADEIRKAFKPISTAADKMSEAVLELTRQRR